ncbi:MAG: glutamine-hydrolyzing carbamoyl-phosphate synthase small subunit [Planctomycetota bacterium]|jgi:carbamoyl-phosphate synthase small subunit|nr:glutamine-hydrolyzing carbamoyl-phosphate synthase small subunit [Planctomycetota bacterium]
MAASDIPATLVLEDGSVFRGRSVGTSGQRAFELVFHTGMTGYQEILTDPSYCGQAVVMTYPQIGNYGCQAAADESDRCWASAMIMRQLTPCTSSWTAEQSLQEYFLDRDVMAMDGVDTRELTLILRNKGAQRAIISTETDDVATLLELARAHKSLDNRDLASEVSCKQSYTWSEGLPDTETWNPSGLHDGARKLVCYDFGIKRNILRNLVSAGFAPVVVPVDTPAADVLAMKPDAVFLSNGPGDPAAVTAAIEAVSELVAADMPLFGICLGHQILALALGGRTYKMKFGHHGANHPVVEPASGRIDISSQNHGFAVDPDSLEGTGLEVSHYNGNDKTVAGLRHNSKPVFSVQYHPEGAPGPHDPEHLFQRFMSLLAEPAAL